MTPAKTYKFSDVVRALEFLGYKDQEIINALSRVASDHPTPAEPEFVKQWVANVEQYAEERGADKISEYHRNCLKREAQLMIDLVESKVKSLQDNYDYVVRLLNQLTGDGRK
jgi:hypothetical protein